MSKKQDISALYRLEFYKKQKAWCFSRQNIAANVNGKMQFYSKNCDTTKRQTKEMLIDTVKTRKSKDLNRNCVTTQFQTKIRKPICEKQTRLACLFQREMSSNKSVDVVDGGVPKTFDGKLCNNNTNFSDNEEKSAKEFCHSDTLNQTYSVSDVPTTDMTLQTDTFFSQPYILDNNNNALLKTSCCHDVEMLDDIQFEESNLTFDDEFPGTDELLNISGYITSSFMIRKSKMDANLSTSVSENGFMDGISKTAHSSELDLANYDLAEEVNSFVEMQMAPYNADKAGFQLDNNQPQELSPDLNQHTDANPETMSYAELIKAISREQMHIMHHSQRKQSLMRAVRKKVIMDSENGESIPSRDVMYSDISGLPRGRGRINNMIPTPGFARDCSMGIGRGYMRKFLSDI